jgi:hypothetical protein
MPVASLNDSAAEPRDQATAFEGYSLRSHPNPFNPATKVQFDLPHASRAEVRVYDEMGRLVTRLGGDLMPAGSHSIVWRGTDHRGARVVSGVYFLRLFVDGQLRGDTVKMTLVK